MRCEMENIFGEMRTFIEQEVQGDFNVNEEKGFIDSWLQTEHGPVHMIFQVLGDEKDHVIFSVRSILSVPLSFREECTRLLNMINWELILGNFEMDPQDGELAFRVPYCLCHSEISHNQFKHGFNSAMGTAVAHYPLFQKVIWSGITAEEAFADIRMNLEEKDITPEMDEGIPENYAEEIIESLSEAFGENLDQSQNS